METTSLHTSTYILGARNLNSYRLIYSQVILLFCLFIFRQLDIGSFYFGFQENV